MTHKEQVFQQIKSLFDSIGVFFSKADFASFTGEPLGDPGLQFICPRCQRTKLEEVVSAEAVSTTLLRLDPDGAHDFNIRSTEAVNPTGVEAYRCTFCEETVKDANGDDITDSEDLAEWLREQPYNKEETEENL